MKTKKIIAIILLTICLVLTVSGCKDVNDTDNGERHKITGRCLVASNDTYIIVAPDEGPVVMTDMSENKNLFKDVQTGDKIEITHGAILESYPGQTNAYSCKIIEKGGLEDIPQDIYDELNLLGWFD